MKIEASHLLDHLRIFSKSTLPLATYWFKESIMWTGIVTLLAVNTYVRSTVQSQNNSVNRTILQSPLSPVVHKKAAVMYWEAGMNENAKQENILAQSLLSQTSTSVLGDQTSLETEVQQWESQPAKLAAGFEFWKRIASQKPDYRDAYLQAADAATKLGKIREAIRLLQKATELDPTYMPAITLLTYLQNQ